METASLNDSRTVKVVPAPEWYPSGSSYRNRAVSGSVFSSSSSSTFCWPVPGSSDSPVTTFAVTELVCVSSSPSSLLKLTRTLILRYSS